jgi:hypothetical protein
MSMGTRKRRTAATRPGEHTAPAAYVFAACKRLQPTPPIRQPPKDFRSLQSCKNAPLIRCCFIWRVRRGSTRVSKEWRHPAAGQPEAASCRLIQPVVMWVVGWPAGPRSLLKLFRHRRSITPSYASAGRTGAGPGRHAPERAGYAGLRLRRCAALGRPARPRCRGACGAIQAPLLVWPRPMARRFSRGPPPWPMRGSGRPGSGFASPRPDLRGFTSSKALRHRA